MYLPPEQATPLPLEVVPSYAATETKSSGDCGDTNPCLQSATVSGRCGRSTHRPGFKFGECSSSRTSVRRRDCRTTRQLPLMPGARRDASGAKEALARDGASVAGAQALQLLGIATPAEAEPHL